MVKFILFQRDYIHKNKCHVFSNNYQWTIVLHLRKKNQFFKVCLYFWNSSHNTLHFSYSLPFVCFVPSHGRFYIILSWKIRIHSFIYSFFLSPELMGEPEWMENYGMVQSHVNATKRIKMAYGIYLIKNTISVWAQTDICKETRICFVR